MDTSCPNLFLAWQRARCGFLSMISGGSPISRFRGVLVNFSLGFQGGGCVVWGADRLSDEDGGFGPSDESSNVPRTTSLDPAVSGYKKTAWRGIYCELRALQVFYGCRLVRVRRHAWSYTSETRSRAFSRALSTHVKKLICCMSYWCIEIFVKPEGVKWRKNVSKVRWESPSSGMGS